MSEPIKVGDLVWAAKDCCGYYLGTVFRVSGFEDAEYGAKCVKCGFRWNGIRIARSDDTNCRIQHFPPEWLKRIPPLSELEGQRTEESLRTPTKERV